jgi:tetratricopeptide (TPR) repeat protein
VHYEFATPADLHEPVTIDVKLQYRKFDQRYMHIVAERTASMGAPIRGYEPGQTYRNELPIVTIASDSITLPVAGATLDAPPPARDIPEWQRWNDYGIGLLLKGKAELRQAAEAFAEVERLGRWDGPLNLTRVYNLEGRLDEAVAALQRAESFSAEEGFPRWTWAWLSGDVNRQQGRLDAAIRNLRSALFDSTPEMQARGFDFSKDYEVLNLLGQTLFDLGRMRARQGRQDEAMAAWREAVETFGKTLALDSENVTAHYNLQLLHAELGDEAKSAEHAALHARYKPDDNAQGRAVRLARERYPAANHAAEAVVKYPLQRTGAPGLEVDAPLASSAHKDSAFEIADALPQD